MTTRTAEAALKRREATRSHEFAAAFPAGSTDATALYHKRHAAELEAEAKALLTVDGPREVTFGETAPDAADRAYVAVPALKDGWLRETLQDPDAVAVEASFSRQTRLIEADVLEAGFNARCRDAHPCRQPVVHGRKRCRMHGGTNPGAPCGRHHSNYKHGRRNIEAMERRREARALIKALRGLMLQCRD